MSDSVSPYSLKNPKSGRASLRLVRPQDIDGTLASVDGGNGAATVQHIENDWKRPVKRTTLVWDGTDWGNEGDGFEPGRIRRRAIVGPIVENTGQPPFYSVILDEIRIDRVDSGGAVWGTVTATSGAHCSGAGSDLEAGRDAALDMALAHCATGRGADGSESLEMASELHTGRPRKLGFALVNRVVVLAFAGSRGSRPPKGRTPPLAAIGANVGEALFLPDFEKNGERVDLLFEGGIALDNPASLNDAERLLDLIGDLPVVTAGCQRSRLPVLIRAFGGVGLRSLAPNARLSVDVSASEDDDLAGHAEKILAAAGMVKRQESGWLTPRRQPDAS